MSEYNEQRAAFDNAVKTLDGNNSFAAARASRYLQMVKDRLNN